MCWGHISGGRVGAMIELTLREMQEAALGVLIEVADICEAQGLRYYLAYGTLIGAARHRGFIPWDDDLDIFMPRPDHDALVGYLTGHGQERPHLEAFTKDTCRGYPYMITRISDNRYAMETRNEKPYGLGAFIDVYPLDGLGNNRQEAFALCCKGNYLSSFCFQTTRAHFTMDNMKGMKRTKWKYLVFLVSKILGKKFFQRQLTKLSRQYPYEQSRYVSTVTWLSGVKMVYEKEWFSQVDWLTFEGHAFRVPKGYEEFLRFIYGNYMALPPVNARSAYMLRKCSANKGQFVIAFGLYTADLNAAQ